MKIVGRKALGIESVYDIGLAQDHNFLLNNGCIAANCFNKSHSVAYGYVTYQTAYLKANYPVEYMAALLSSVSGDQDKVQRYIANCRNMGIDVLPPDINSSGEDFTPRGRQILFGLAAIKNLGAGPITAILQARREGGAFTSLADLCSRLDSRSLNKKALEALIQTGALDLLEPNRHQLMHDLDVTMDWASRRAKEQASGQGNLFDLLGGNSNESFDLAPTTSRVPDYSSQEKLHLEKELLGFYISDHPLSGVSRSAKLMAPINLCDIPDSTEVKMVTAIALIVDIKDVITKKGEPMAILQLEDLTGNTEAVVFPKMYSKVKPLLHKDKRVMVWGKIDRRDEQTQLIIEDMQSIESVKMVKIELTKEQASDRQVLNQLRNVLNPPSNYGENGKGHDENFGKVPVIAAIEYLPKVVRFGNRFWVQDEESAVKALLGAGFKASCDGLVH